MTDDSVSFASPLDSQEKKTEEIIATPYTWGIRLGGGYAISLLDFDFKMDGMMQGTSAQVLDYDEHAGFNFDANLEVKFGMPKPFDKISVGIAFNYYYISVKELEMEIQGATLVKVSEDDLAEFHVFSFMAFLEYRHPIPVGRSWLSPYARFGIGMNANMNSDRNLLEVEDTTLGMMFAIGLEYHISSQMSVFFEPRWHYNRADYVMRPFDTQSKFRGTVDLSTVTFLVGINFYFGAGESL